MFPVKTRTSKWEEMKARKNPAGLEVARQRYVSGEKHIIHNTKRNSVGVLKARHRHLSARCLHYLWVLAHLEIKHLLICQKHKQEVLPISLKYKFGRQKTALLIYLMSTTAGDQKPQDPLPSVFCSHRGQPERGERGEQVGGVHVEPGVHWARSQLPIRRGQPPESTPLCTYLRSLLFMFAFTLKQQQHTWRQRWIGKQAGGGRVTPFVKKSGEMLMFSHIKCKCLAVRNLT